MVIEFDNSDDMVGFDDFYEKDKTILQQDIQIVRSEFPNILEAPHKLNEVVSFRFEKGQDLMPNPFEITSDMYVTVWLRSLTKVKHDLNKTQVQMFQDAVLVDSFDPEDQLSLRLENLEGKVRTFNTFVEFVDDREYLFLIYFQHGDVEDRFVTSGLHILSQVYSDNPIKSRRDELAISAASTICKLSRIGQSSV